MNTNLIATILAQKSPCVIVSPHFDDAYLSCSTILEKLSGKVDVTVINVFTKAHKGPYTLSARQALQSAYCIDGDKLYNDRKEEDKKVLSQFNIKVVNLGFQDALFRRKKSQSILGKYFPELDHYYPTYKFHITKKPNKKDIVTQELFTAIKKYLKPGTFLFIPYGVGNHVDHLLVRNVCELNYDKNVLYVDFPYNSRLSNNGDAKKHSHVYFQSPNMVKKTKNLQLYKTQYNGLFPKGVPDHQEIFYW